MLGIVCLTFVSININILNCVEKRVVSINVFRYGISLRGNLFYFFVIRNVLHLFALFLTGYIFIECFIFIKSKFCHR